LPHVTTIPHGQAVRPGDIQQEYINRQYKRVLHITDIELKHTTFNTGSAAGRIAEKIRAAV